MKISTHRLSYKCCKSSEIFRSLVRKGNYCRHGDVKVLKRGEVYLVRCSSSSSSVAALSSARSADMTTLRVAVWSDREDHDARNRSGYSKGEDRRWLITVHAAFGNVGQYHTDDDALSGTLTLAKRYPTKSVASDAVTPTEGDFSRVRTRSLRAPSHSSYSSQERIYLAEIEGIVRILPGEGRGKIKRK